MPICYEPSFRRKKISFIKKVRLALLGYSSTHLASIPNRHGKYLKQIENHIEATKYRYINSSGVILDFPIKNCLVPFIIKEENRDEYPKALDLARLLGTDDDSTFNDDIESIDTNAKTTDIALLVNLII
jgi:hypothetical protein